MNLSTALNLENFNFSNFPLTLINPDISLKAKALLVIILHWRYDFLDPSMEKEKFLCNISKESINAIRSGIKELQNAGLLQKVIQRNQNERKYVTGSKWELLIEWPSDWANDAPGNVRIEVYDGKN